MGKKLIMVMGVQGSGTTAIFQSLEPDPALTSWDESEDSLIYKDFFFSGTSARFDHSAEG
jgi:hypothetical protein